jgi:autotransporter-associated beta strand protein
MQFQCRLAAVTLCAVLSWAVRAPAFAQLSLATLQQNYVAKGYGMFLHYNMSTYTNENWAHTGLDVNTFNPTTSLVADTQQWAATAKAAGMKYGVLTTKHHDGYALWNAAGSTYDIASTTWYNDPSNQNYHQDIVQDFVTAFRNQGLGVDLYFSMWDQMAGIGSPYYANDPHPTLLNSAQATTYVENQINQLLTNYGQIDALWIDGWNWRSDVSSLISYNTIYSYVKSISPNTLLVDNDPNMHSLSTSDIVEYEVGPQPPAGNTVPSEYCNTMRDDMRWFYNTANNNVYKSANVVGNQIRAVNALGSNYLLNVPPDTSGQIPTGAVQNLMAIKANLDRPNPDLALGKSASQSSTWNNNPNGFGANLATDGNPDNFTNSGSGDYNPWWEVDLGAPTLIGDIDLLNRKGNYGRLRDITVQILAADGHTVVYTSPLLNPNDVLGWGDPTDYTRGPDPLTVNLGRGVTGEFIRVSRTPAAGYTTDSTGNTYILNLGDVGVYAPATSLTWVGTNSTTWVDNANVPNVLSWTSATNPAGDYFTTQDFVTFDNHAVTTSVSLSGSLVPGSITVTGSNNFTFSGGGAIGGVTGLTLTGPGSLTIANTGNSYSGATLVQGGTLVAGANNAFSPASALVLGSSAGNGTVDLAGFSQTVASLGTDPLALAAGQTIGNSAASTTATLTINGSSTYGGTIQDGMNGSGGQTALTVAAGLVNLSGSNTYSGPTTIGAGTLTVNGALTQTSTISVGSSAMLAGSGLIGGNTSLTTLTVNGTINLSGGTIGGALNAAGGNWTGNGTVNGLVTSGSNVFTVASGGTLNAAGNMTLSGGTLTGQGAISGGTLTLGSGALIAPGATANINNIGTLTLPSLFASGGGTLNLDLSNTTTPGNGVNDLLQVAGNLSLGGTTTLAIYPTAGSLAVGAPYTLFTYGGNLSHSGTLVLAPGSLGGRDTAAFNYGSGAVTMTVSGYNANLTWIGTGSTTWANNSSIKPWSSLTSPSGDYFTAGDSVTFNNSAAAGETTITLSGALAPASVTVTGTNNFTFTGGGSIGGSTGVTLVGPGALTIANTGNSYSGPTVIQGGTLVLGTSGALPVSTALVLGAASSAGTLDLAGYSQSVGSLAIGAGAAGSGQTITNSAGNATLTYNGAGFSVFPGTVQDNVPSGILGLTVGSGTLDLTSANAAYSGPTNVNGGALFISALPNSSVVNLANTAALGLVGMGAKIPAPINNAGSVTFSGGSGTLSGAISGAGRLTELSGGPLTLAGSLNVTGLVAVNSGTLVFNGASGTLGQIDVGAASGSSTMYFHSGSLTETGRLYTGYATGGTSSFVQDGGVLNLVGTAATLDLSYTSSVPTTFTLTGGTFNVNTALGAATLGQNGPLTYNQSGGLFNFNSSSAANNFLQTAFNPAAPTTLSISGGTFQVAGNNVLYLGVRAAGTMTVSGNALVTVGSVAFNRASSGPTSTAAGILNLNGGTLQAGTIYESYNGSSVSGGTLNFNGGLLQAAASSSPAWISANSHLTLDINAGGAVIDTNEQNVTIAANLQDGSGGMADTVTKVGNGTLTLSGTNTYMGVTTVNGGTLIVANNKALTDGTSVAIGDPSRLCLLPAAAVTSITVPAAQPPVASVPEPGTLLLAAFGLCSALVYRHLGV